MALRDHTVRLPARHYDRLLRAAKEIDGAAQAALAFYSSLIQPAQANLFVLWKLPLALAQNTSGARLGRPFAG